MTRKVAVVGTGAAGLSATAHLARAGHEVIALERNPWVGGLLHPFLRDGYEFDPGVHYLGQCGPGGPFSNELEHLGLHCSDLVAPMDDDFDHYRFGDFEIAMCVGVDHYRERLEAAFPDDTRGVQRVMNAVEHLLAAQRVGTPGRHAMPEYFKAAGAVSLIRWLHATYREFLEWACEDERLRMVFAAACGDYGLPPSRAAAGFGLAVLAHYIGGAYFPLGGAGRFRDRLVAVGRDHGAEFRTSAGVDAIETHGGHAVAIVTDDGERIAVDGVVTAIDPRHVYGSMLPADVVRPETLDKVERMESSLSACCLYLGVRRDLRDHGWGAYNVWDYPDWDIDAAYEPMFRGELPDELPFFISPNSLKDPTGSMAPDGCSTVEVIVPCPWEMFARWENVPADERGEEYETLVEKMRRRVMGELEERHPELVADVEVCELSTPLAFRHHVNAIEGGLYGPAHSPGQTFNSRFAPRGKLGRLTLCGQGVVGCGVSTAIMSGRVAANLLARQLEN